ncbi:uncharacterized protein LOC143910015 [Arctopsyche grandis]|uniref:uncharacterized protein LOC143910015 n=1 Tax=Arctopsyche grandis TaxID=121162 RepID=UPI00406D8710
MNENIKKATEKKLTINQNMSVPKKKKIRFGLFQLVPCYTGKQIQLELIHRALTENKESTIAQVAAITGLGGVGKSQLAVKYAIEYSDYYDSIIFINSEKKDSIETSFKSLAKELGIPVIEERIERKRSLEREKNIIYVIRSIYRYFEGTKLLIILDNVESYSSIKDCIFSYSSSNKTISTLITSRDWKCCIGDEGAIELIPLDIFTEDEAMNFAKNYLSNENEEDVKTLIKILDNLPLAMKQALCYIKEENKNSILKELEQLTIKQYLDLYGKENHMSVDRDLNLMDNVDNKTVTTTCMITIKKIEENIHCGQLALKIFHILAYFAPENIQFEELFSDLTIDDEQLWQAVELLHKYSLIHLYKGVVHIHRLVQQATRINLKRKGEEEHVLREALELLKGSNFEEHAVSVWEHSYQYSKLFDDFFFISEYTTRKNRPLNLLLAYGNDSEAIEFLCSYNHISRCFKMNSFAIEHPLCIAAEYGNTNIVTFLCRNKSKLLKSILHIALHQAAINGHLEVVTFLQNELLILNLKHEIDDKIFDMVAINGHKNIIEILKPNDYGLYLFYAALMSALLRGNHHAYKLMIENVIAKNPHFLQHTFGYEENSILHIVSGKGNVEAVEILLNYIDMNICNKFNDTPIFSAAKASNEDVLIFLLEKGADIETTDLSRRSLLHFAASACRVDTLRKLVEKGLNPRGLDEFLHYPIYYANYGNNNSAVKFFMEEAMTFDTAEDKANLINEIVIGSLQMDTINLLIKLGAEINSALMWALLQNKYNYVKFILEAGADPNVPNSGYYKIVLHEAVMRKYLRMVKLLLKAGANANVIDKYDDNALHKATIFENKFSIVKLLVQYGCDVRAVNKDGETPLDIAISRGRDKRIIELLKNQMDSSTKF